MSQPHPSYQRTHKYTFGYAPSGHFTLLNKWGEPFYERALPLFQKVLSHLLWLVLFLILTRLHPWFMAFVFFSLFLLGMRLTALMLSGGLRPILFPPLWVRLSNQLRRGADERILAKHGLEKHPGLLTNLILSQLHTPSNALVTTERALELYPDHEVLQSLYNFLTKTE